MEIEDKLMRTPKHTNVVDNRKLDIQKFCLALSRIHNNVINLLLLSLNLEMKPYYFRQVQRRVGAAYCGHGLCYGLVYMIKLF